MVNPSEQINHGPKKSSGGFSHFIHNIEKNAKNAAHTINTDIHKVSSKVANGIKEVPHIIEEGALATGHAAQRVVAGVADTIDNLEKKVLPSPSAVIGETALLVGGLAIVGVLVLKFL